MMSSPSRVLVVLSLSALLTSFAQAQLIHRDSLAHFYGVVMMTATSEPRGWPGNNPLEPALASDEFATYYTGVSGDARWELQMRHKPARYDTLHEEVVFVNPYAVSESALAVQERDLVVTSLSNGGYETSRNVLAYWRTRGDSLYFLALHRKPFAQGLGRVGLGSDYVVDAESDVYFVLEGSGGDAGFIDNQGILVRLNDSLKLEELHHWRYGVDLDREDQTNMSYTFVEEGERPALRLIEQHFKWFYDPNVYGAITDSVFVRSDTVLIDLRARP